MTHSMPFRLALPIALALVGVCWSTAASAQSAPGAATPTDTVRLTDEQRMAILDGNTPESAAAARGELSGSDRARRGIHGEVGVMIGTNGARGIYGAAEIPLGENGAAVVSFENSQYGYRRR
jgi:hypothetical protein